MAALPTLAPNAESTYFNASSHARMKRLPGPIVSVYVCVCVCACVSQLAYHTQYIQRGHQKSFYKLKRNPIVSGISVPDKEYILDK